MIAFTTNQSIECLQFYDQKVGKKIAHLVLLLVRSMRLISGLGAIIIMRRGCGAMRPLSGLGVGGV